ncbi:carcinine transporter-like [Anticarsia gemmatalis]|uniref:carcinine transporter-like n=1 Tax=Anticarsia gemmatalis TaxID=129554 RepID=UPI003F75A6FD
MAAEKVTRTSTEKVDGQQDRVEYDDLLVTAGELGRYQWSLFFCSFPFFAFGVFVYYSQMFITEVSPNHWCRIPGLENFTEMERRDLGIPKDEHSRFGYSQCTMYDVNWTDILTTGEKPDQNWTVVPCQYGWEFNKSEIPYPTIGRDYEWVCDKNSYQATAQSIFFVGSIVGGFLFGWVSDRYGRIPATVASCLAGCIGGLSSSFARNHLEFTITRFIVGMSYDTCMITIYLLVLEYIAPRYRTIISNMAFAIFYALFATVIPWIALACGHWKTICLVTSLPLATAVLTRFFIPESPMWLISKGRIDDAVEKILVIGRTNKKEVPPKMIEQFKLTMKDAKNEQNQSALEIFRRPVVRKMFILICLEYMCCAIVFDGLIRSIGQLEFDYFASFSLVSSTEFPSVVIVAFVMDHVGRRWMTIVFMGASAVFCLLTVFASGVQTVIFAVTARFCVNMAFSAAIQWAPEILPTSVRGSGVAIVHICGYVATFLSPYIVYLKEYIYWLPLVVVSGICVSGSLVAFGLPETAMKGMPHTFEDAEELTKNQKLWSLPYLEERKQKKEKAGQINQSFELEP